jgi:hypothetical protein
VDGGILVVDFGLQMFALAFLAGDVLSGDIEIDFIAQFAGDAQNRADCKVKW